MSTYRVSTVHRSRNMPTNNNNQKVPSAAARLAKLPVVLSACSKLSVLYVDTKCSHPSLRSVFEVLENSVTVLGTVASDTMSPVIVKLEPQISIANDVACKSLDWLETTFPVLHAPTEQIVVSAKNKMLKIQDMVNITANGTVDCVQHTVAWVIERMRQVDEQSNHAVVERAINVASVGLDSALNMSEALMDRMLPAIEEEKEEEACLMEGFEAAAPLRRSYPVRVATLATELSRRAYRKAEAMMLSVEIMKTLSMSSYIPQYLQQQVFLLIFKMNNFVCPSPQQNHSSQDSGLDATETTLAQNDGVKISTLTTPCCRMRRPIRMPVFDNGCNVKGCMRR